MKKDTASSLIGWHLDFLGFSASSLCAVHCILMPFVLSLSFLSGLRWLENPWVEGVLILTALLIAAISLFRSYRSHYRFQPLIFAGLGFLTIAMSRIMPWEALEPILMGAGGFAIAYAHYANWSLLKHTKPEV